METKEQILAYFLEQHAALGNRVDAPDVPEFDKRHRKLWAKCDEELNKRLVKLEAQDTLTPEEEAELQSLKDYLSI